jgi:SPP1 gp7 family putative phage head morphogenesis protein
VASGLRRRAGVGENDVVLKSVRANCGVEAWYREKLRALLADMSASMQLHVAAAWKAQPPTIGFAQDDANSSIVLRRSLAKWGKNWVSKFDALAGELARRFAGKAFSTTDNALRASLKAAGFTVQFKPTKASVEAYQAVVAQNVALIKNLPRDYLHDLQNSVWDSVMKGADLSTLSKTLQTNYGMSYRRAALISRTENHKAKAIIENVRRRELGIQSAIWMHSSAGKVPRPTHVAMNGQRYELGKGMWDSNEGEFVFPGQLINCRCTSRAIIPGLDES